jgi:hypothetical protein
MHYEYDRAFLIDAAVTKFYLVKTNGFEHVTPVTATGDFAIGVAQESATAGDVANGKIIGVRLLGVARCVAQAPIAVGLKVRAHSSGKITTVDATAGANNQVVGIALTAAAADGDHIDVLLTPGATSNAAAS